MFWKWQCPKFLFWGASWWFEVYLRVMGAPKHTQKWHKVIGWASKQFFLKVQKVLRVICKSLLWDIRPKMWIPFSTFTVLSLCIESYVGVREKLITSCPQRIAIMTLRKNWMTHLVFFNHFMMIPCHVCMFLHACVAMAKSFALSSYFALLPLLGKVEKSKGMCGFFLLLWCPP